MFENNNNNNNKNSNSNKNNNSNNDENNKITGHSKKSVSRTVHLFFVGLYYCFTQTRCINND